ncbi:MFS transporter [Pararhodospirillum oryzae]|uniref:MFS transporter n=1 Tax=Pararhodospirillum oryzae TaxID=478448 RepID=A0A512H4W3_9PROT|nr:MFS transporter [Pararhodospirillum oryzae]GEO80481.1 MFS transporter [Pararhodospirillum oryzae]
MSTHGTQGRLALGFSCIGHAFSHVFEPVFFVVALSLPTVFGISYETALTLIVGGKLLFGIAAPFTGWLGDRWSATGMMTLFFLGTGGGAIWAGLSGSPVEMALALGVLGLFGSIYHPVGIAWLVHSAVNRGRALGINGAFGGFGPAVAALGAGALIDSFGWRAAFLVPGALCVLTGLVFLLSLARGWVSEKAPEANPEPPPDRRDAVRVYVVLAGVMLCGGLIYQSTQAAMPKLFEERMGSLLGEGALGIGSAVMLVYGLAGILQIGAGHLADRYALKAVYIAMYLIQAPALVAVAMLGGLPLGMAMMIAVCGNIGALPAENSLLARYTPARWRSTAYGLKFVLSFGVSGLGVPLVSVIRGTTGDFTLLFLILGGLALIVSVLLLSLPSDRKNTSTPTPVPAE